MLTGVWRILNPALVISVLACWLVPLVRFIFDVAASSRVRKELMDPITSAITNALNNVSVQVISDAYRAFKASLEQEFGTDNELLEAVNDFEKYPDSVDHQETLREEVARFGADKDNDLLALAHKLLYLINTVHSTAPGRNIVNISNSTVQGFITENRGDVTMNFGGRHLSKE